MRHVWTVKIVSARSLRNMYWLRWFRLLNELTLHSHIQVDWVHLSSSTSNVLCRQYNMVNMSAGKSPGPQYEDLNIHLFNRTPSPDLEMWRSEAGVKKGAQKGVLFHLDYLDPPVRCLLNLAADQRQLSARQCNFKSLTFLPELF